MSTFLHDILDMHELERLVREKYISRVLSAELPLILYNYSEKATYDRLWTPETRQCRGLVVEEGTGRIVARPFKKFFNCDETGIPEVTLANLMNKSGPIEVTDKLDGSNVNVWYYDHSWHTSTRGSFVSKQAQAAGWWLTHSNIKLPRETDHTFICEWCAPDNRVVLKYDKPGLHLLGVRRPNGYDAGADDRGEWSKVTGIPSVPMQYGYDLLGLLAESVFAREIEGWVVRWPDGMRVKIKTEDYIRLHRIVSGFSPERIREAMLTGEHERYFQELPEELRAEAEEIGTLIAAAVMLRVTGLTTTFARLKPFLGEGREGRKAYALEALKEPSADHPHLFSLSNGRDITQSILEDLDLKELFKNREPVTQETA